MSPEPAVDQPVLTVQDDDSLRILRLNRPDHKNALNGALLGAITDELRRAAGDETVRAVVLTGVGSAFCAGLDLADAGQVSTAPPAGSRTGASVGYDAADNMAMLARVTCTKPIVAAVNGAAVGMGVALAMAADIRIAGPSARFHPGYVRVGASPDGGATWTVTEALGYERAMRFFLESRMVGADEALEIGLVGEVVDSDEALEPYAIDYGRRLCSLAPLAVRQTKELLGRAVALADLARHLDDEVHATIRALSAGDGRRAIEAYLTGRPATFTGT